MSFTLLSAPIRKYIREKGWEQLRPIQHAAIEKILTTDAHYILASRTASGKTEAAFLPILSQVNFNEPGVQVLYISPLIALINDQFERIEALCKNLEVTVTKWHGEANRAAKQQLLKQPEGVVLITPESLEAMFVNKPFHVRQLFSCLKFVVIDEIHAFIGTDRGIQLKSILSRLQAVNEVSFRIIGLSATIGDYQEAKRFTGEEARTKVLLDKTAREIQATFRYFKGDGEELPLELLKDLYLETKDNKVLIFPNNRGRAEEVAVKLRKISDRVKGHPYYFSHHSSVDKEVREYVENFAKNNRRFHFCIACTSTFELGIDIGTVDEVVQIDATSSIASLIQRVGRSGRKEGEKSYLFLYATNPWSLLQSLACWLLYQEGFIEPPSSVNAAYDILLHQALSITKSHSGIGLLELTRQLKDNAAFHGIEAAEITEIINHLLVTGVLEKIQQEVIIGIEGEKIVNHRDFYSVFKTEQNFKVVHGGHTVGDIPFSPQIREAENILLAAKVWKITNVDLHAKKIEVVPTHDGKKPTFYGTGTIVHPRIREKMFEILHASGDLEVLNEESNEEIRRLRKDFSVFRILDLETERPLLKKEKGIYLFSFTGTRVNRTLQLLLHVAGIASILEDDKSRFKLEITPEEFYEKWPLLIRELSVIDVHIQHVLEITPNLLDFSKWGRYLALKYQVKLTRQKYYDIEQTEKFISTVKWIENA